MSALSDHFDSEEFACKCCGLVEMEDSLIDALEELRFDVKRPVIVVSGFRCEKHNKEIGGSDDSQHVKGKAADIWVMGMPLLSLFTKVVNVPLFRNGGVGVYPDHGFIHVDVRGEAARWGKLGDKFVGLKVALAVAQEDMNG